VNYMSCGKEISGEYANNNNFTYLLSVWCIVTKFQTLNSWRAFWWLLDSVKSGHFEPSSCSPAEKTGDGY